MKLTTLAFFAATLAAMGVAARPSRVIDPSTVEVEVEESPETLEENAAAFRAIGFDLSRGNHFGAPKRPSQAGATPGWYFGKYPEKHPKLPCLNGTICKTLTKYPKHLQCPRPPPTGPTTTVTSTTTATVTSAATTTTTRSTSTSTSTSTTSTTSSSSAAPSPSTVPGYTPTFLDQEGATESPDYLTYGLVDTVDDCKAMCNNVPGCGFINTYHDVNAKDGSTQLSCALFTFCHDHTTNVGGQEQLGNGSINYIVDSDGYCKNV